jgi:hypothetical protein
MGGRFQTDWRHCVPKQTSPADSRISVNFAASSQTLPHFELQGEEDA